MIRALVIFFSVYVALLIQEFLPPLPFLDNARLYLVPSIFCYGALWLPFPAMLGLAVYTGLLSDLAFLHVIDDRVEIGLGWSILFYVFAGTILHALRSLRTDLRWEVHCLASGAVTLLLLLGQYFMVCLRREAFHLDGTVVWHIAGPSVTALLLAPVIYHFLQLWPGGFAKTQTPGRARLKR